MTAGPRVDRRISFGVDHRPLGRPTAVASVELGAAAEALAARGRLARVALEAGEGSAVVAAVVGANPSGLSAARVALGTPGQAATLSGFLALPLTELAHRVEAETWRISHVLPRALQHTLRSLAAAAVEGFPDAASSLERAGGSVIGAWECTTRERRWYAASLGRFAERARLSLALARAMLSVETPSAFVRSGALAAAGCSDLNEPARSHEDALSLLLTDPGCPFSVAFCLGRIQEASGRLDTRAPWLLPAAWRDLAALEPGDSTPGALESLGDTLATVEESVFAQLGWPMLRVQRSEPSPDLSVGQ